MFLCELRALFFVFLNTSFSLSCFLRVIRGSLPLTVPGQHLFINNVFSMRIFTRVSLTQSQGNRRGNKHFDSSWSLETSSRYKRQR